MSFGKENLSLGDPLSFLDWRDFSEYLSSRFSIFDQAISSSDLPFYDSQGRIIMDSDGHYVYDTDEYVLIDGDTIRIKGEQHVSEGAIDTEQIEDNAIYILGKAEADGPITLTTSYQTCASVSVTTQGQPLFVHVHYGANRLDTPNPYTWDPVDFQIRRDSTELYQPTIYPNEGTFYSLPSQYMTCIGMIADEPSAGTYTYDIRAKRDAAMSSQGGAFRIYVTEALT